VSIKAVLATASDSVDISAAIEELLETPEESAQRTGVQDLYELYSDMMGEESDWAEIARVTISKIDLHLLAGIINVRLTTDFVVSVDLKVVLGLEFDYLSADRYNFWLRIKEKNAGSNSVRLMDQKTNFNFYVMGAIRARAGLDVQIAVGLFSVDLASVGLGVETGAQLRLYGFFFYEYKSVNGQTTLSRGSGAMYFDMDIYLEVYFLAQVGAGKYSYRPTLYSTQWPILKAGSQYNAFDFYEPETLTQIRMKNSVQTMDFPGNLFTMQNLDLTTGEASGKQYPQSNFEITFTNPAFYLNNGKLAVNVLPEEHVVEGNMIVRYKNASLAFTSLPVTRTVRVRWDDVNDGGYAISFVSNGGSYVPPIVKPYNADVSAPALPVKAGYTFGGWYLDAGLQNEYTFGKMGVSNILLYAKWTANNDTPYQVQHWQEAVSGGGFALFHTDYETGTTDTATTPAVMSYEGFYSPNAQTAIISGDGAAVVRYEYPRKSYTLTFASGYDAAKDLTGQVKYNADIILPQMAREGYTFTGWNTEPVAKMPAADLTYTANWSINSYTAEFWLNGQQVSAETQTNVFKSSLNLYQPELPNEFSRFSGWYTDSHLAAAYKGVTMPAKNLLLFGEIVDNAVGYTVNHYWQNIAGDDYTLKEAESRIGSKNSSVTPPHQVYAGFTPPADTQTVTVAEDGTTVVDYYYTRNSYTVSFAEDDDGLLDLDSDLPDSITERHGAEVPLSAVTATGYDFAGWYDPADEEETFAGTMVVPIGNITLKPQFTPSTDTAYRVEHWLRASDGSYARDDAKTQNQSGTTGEVTAAEPLEMANFVPQPFEQEPIARDGSTVVRIDYYPLVLEVNNFDELQTAVAHVYPTATILMKADITVTSELQTPITCTIDGGGHRLLWNGSDSSIFISINQTGSTVTFKNIVIDGNNQEVTGIFVQNHSALVIEDNTAIQHCLMRGVRVTGESSVVMHGGAIRDNDFVGAISAGSSGGGMSIDGRSSGIMNGGSISGNWATDGGGVAVSGKGSTFEMNNNSSISENEAWQGGGVAVWAGGSFTMNGGYIQSNTATGAESNSQNFGHFGGGGIAVYEEGFAEQDKETAFTLNGGTIGGNNAVESGGGIRIDASGPIQFVGGKILGNTSGTRGGGLHLCSGVILVDNATITGNSAPEDPDRWINR
jgi:uncharacterized repeat protein (TIGR02543 family)